LVELRTQPAASLVADAHIPQGLARVCMHVLMPIDRDVRVEREARTLIEQGYQVTVVDLLRGDEEALVEVNKAIQVRHLPVPRKFTATRFKKWATARAALLFFRGVFSLLRVPADIYHAHDFNALPATYVAARLKGKPVIFDAHELPLSEISVKARWMQALSKLVLRHIVPRCTAVISVSPPIVQVLQEEYHAARVALVRNIPWYQSVPRSDRLSKHLGLPPETRILLFQGNLGANRALDLLIRSVRFLPSQAVLVLLGPPRLEVQVVLDELIASEGVADRVKILPPVHYSELLSWTASADVGLAVFRPDFSLNVRWCLPNKLFEYLMAGLPILASSLDSVRELVETQQVGRVVEDMTPEGIAAVINELLADPAALEQMRQNALKLVRSSLCWEQERVHLLELYAQINSSSRSSAGSA
jgi:glycosyltransferase involved in cell wall biosynthesis